MTANNGAPRALRGATAYERLIDALREAGRRVNEHGHDRATAQCPAHDDGRPSLSLRAIDGQALAYCFAGCDTSDIVAALGLTMADLFDDPQGATYNYPDGRIVRRTPTKRFSQSGNKTDRSLYHADRVGEAPVVYVVEGEKDVHAIEAADGAAVCSAMGAGKAKRFDWSQLGGKSFVVVADRDKAGYEHAREVAELLAPIAASVSVVEAAAGKDAADHIAAGLGLDEFVSLNDGTPKLWRAVDLQPARQPRWLAKGRLPRAAICLLVGDEGIGKSLLWVWLVAALTTGQPRAEFGIPAGEPQSVLLVITEDDWSTIVLPRLQAAGADLSLIRVLCTESDGSGSPIFPRDIALIRDAAPAPALVVVDAWLDTVPAGLSVRDPQQARQALHPWREVATTTNAAVFLVAHTNRVATGNVRDRYGATGALRQKARLTLFAQRDDDGTLVVGPEKSNGSADVTASRFAIRGVQYFSPTVDHDGTVPVLSYVGDTEHTAREHVAEAYAAEHTGSATDDVSAWLLNFLTGGRRRATAVYDAGEAVGYSKDKLKRAKKRLRVDTTRDGEADAWFWELPTPKHALPCSLAPLDTHPTTSKESTESQREQGSRDTCTGCETALSRPESLARGRCEECRIREGNAS